MNAGAGPLVDVVAGARPNFVKIASILRAMGERRKEGGHLLHRLVHTGQHYDARLSGDFFAQLAIPRPDIELGVGSGTQAEQTAAVMVGYERALLDRRSDLCLVVGDVNSTMAAALAACKLGVRVGHVEAGLRSGDMAMPEEINRRVTDSVSDVFFTTSRTAGKNLEREGAAPDRIFFVGNTMIDTLLAHEDRLRPASLCEGPTLAHRRYLVLTLHRPANVDGAERLARTLAAIGEAARGEPIVFPVHPRTRRMLASIGPVPASIHPVEPQPYLQFNHLVKHSRAVITDSGGITEEATVMGVPCLTLRDTTERPETVRTGTNELIGSDPEAIGPALDRLFAGGWKTGAIPERWDGNAGRRIVEVLERLL